VAVFNFNEFFQKLQDIRITCAIVDLTSCGAILTLSMLHWICNHQPLTTGDIMNEYEQFLNDLAYGIEYVYWFAYLDADGDVCLIHATHATLWHHDNALSATEALSRIAAVDRTDMNL
jgi:hypothetical protein